MCFVSQPVVATAVQILMNKRTAGRRELWYQGACNAETVASPASKPDSVGLEDANTILSLRLQFPGVSCLLPESPRAPIVWTLT